MLRGVAVAPALLAILKRRGVRARLSNDAGAYLCNAMYFWSLDEARRAGRERAVVFVHLPWPAPAAGVRPARRRRTSAPPPTLAALVAALEEVGISLGRAARRSSAARATH